MAVRILPVLVVLMSISQVLASRWVYNSERHRINEENDYLMKYGYMTDMSRVGSIMSHENRRNAIMDFQRMAGIRQTGVIDAKTREMMHAPRCGMPDKPLMNPDPRAPDNYILQGDKWKKTKLSWILSSPGTGLSIVSQRRALHNAFQYWSKVSGIEIRETAASASADIKVSFVTRDHDDGYKFDGQGATLAHAFYPSDGRMHFDDDEKWTELTPDGVNLEIVAAHEVGHSLGIRHSEIRGSVMSPYYQGYSEDFHLKDDDIRAVQALYGSGGYRPLPSTLPSKVTTPRYRETTTKPVMDMERMPNICKMKFDDVLQMGDGRVYVIRSQWMYKLVPSTQGVEEGWPRLTVNILEGFPENPNAVTFSPIYKRIYAFKDNLVWRYYGDQLEGGFPRKVNGRIPKIHSAVFAGDEMLILSGKAIHVFDERELSMRKRYSLRQVFNDAPYGPEAALLDRTPGREALYLFKGPSYFKYEVDGGLLLPGYPHSKQKRWMDCKL